MINMIGKKRVIMVLITSQSVFLSSSPMLMLIIMRDTASIPVGTAHTIPRSISDAANADMPILPTNVRTRPLTMSRRIV